MVYTHTEVYTNDGTILNKVTYGAGLVRLLWQSNMVRDHTANFSREAIMICYEDKQTRRQAIRTFLKQKTRSLDGTGDRQRLRLSSKNRRKMRTKRTHCCKAHTNQAYYLRTEPAAHSRLTGQYGREVADTKLVYGVMIVEDTYDRAHMTKSLSHYLLHLEIKINRILQSKYCIKIIMVGLVEEYYYELSGIPNNRQETNGFEKARAKPRDSKYKETRTKKCKSYKKCARYNSYLVVMSKHDTSVFKKPNKRTQLMRTSKLFRLSKLSRSTRRHKEARRTLETYINTYTNYFRRAKNGNNYNPHYLIMEISTRDVFTVNMVFKYLRLPCFPILTRHFNLVRAKARRSGECKRTKKFTFRAKPNISHDPKLEGNYVSNYRKVEISTRDVFAVSTPTNITLHRSFPNSTRPLRLDRNKYGQSRRPKESKRTLKIKGTIRTKKSFSIVYEANYTRNYPNVVISTRDGFAVIRQINNITYISRVFNTASDDAEGDIGASREGTSRHLIKYGAEPRHTKPLTWYVTTRGSNTSFSKKGGKNYSTYVMHAIREACRMNFRRDQPCRKRSTKLNINLLKKFWRLKCCALFARHVRESKNRTDLNAKTDSMRTIVTSCVRLLECRRCRASCRVMVTLTTLSLTNKQQRRTVTKTRIITFVKWFDSEDIITVTMSRQEVDRAVEQIQEAPPTNELAELQAFIEAQNCSHAEGKESDDSTHDTKTRALIILLHNVPFTANTKEPTEYLNYICILMRIIALSGQKSPYVPGTDKASYATQIENPGYSTQREMVLREPVHYQYIYDPINDIMKRVEKTTKGGIESGAATASTATENEKQQSSKLTEPSKIVRDVGAGKPGEPDSTGKGKQNNLIYGKSTDIHLCTIAETESHAIVTAPAQGQATASTPIECTSESVSSGNTIQQSEQDQTTTTVLSAVIDCSIPECSQTVLQTEPGTEAENEADLSCAFSSDEDTVQQNRTGRKKDISSERHAKIDNRIAAQKEAYWKGKDGLRGVNDPRGEALIPIHAPKMERMNIARMKALEARAKASQAPTVEGDIITPILADIDNANQINYSVVTVGAEFRTQSEVVKQLAQNDPNSIRPKAPANRMKRKDKVLPFPQRRMAAVRQEQAAKSKKRKTKSVPCEATPRKQKALTDSDTDNPVSDASWPTDQDNSIATFRTTKKKMLSKTKAASKKPLPKPTKKKTACNKRQKQTKKPQKKDIDNMVAALQDPLPRHTLDLSSTLGEKETRAIIRKHQARIRAKKARLLKKTKQASQTVVQTAENLQKDTLARAIDMAMMMEVNEDEMDMLNQDGNTTELIGEDLDKAIDGVLDALDTPNSSSSSSSSSSSDSSSSYSDSSDSEEWGRRKTTVLNPFARKVATAAIPATEVHEPSAAEQGVDPIKRTTPLKKVSVVIKKLSNEVLKQFNSFTTPTTDSDADMSAKNITKDRSTSRGRSNDKQDRFNKGRTEGDETGQEGNGQEQPNAGTGQGDGATGGANWKGNTSGKRPRDPPKTGMHDDTMEEDMEDEELPGAKRTMTSIREKLTHVYTKRTKETREKRDEGRTKPSDAFRVDKSNAGEKVKDTTVPLLAPTKLADAPTLSLKDLVPEADRRELEEQGQDESFKTDRIEFVVVEREVTPGEEDIAVRADELEWEFPERDSFDMIIGMAIDIYTEDDWDLIDYMSFSSVGWNTGVGLFAFGSDKLEQMGKFREVLRNLKIGNKRFESYPKRMLLNRYAITIYFNAAFAWSPVPKLLFWFRKLNGFEGNLTMAETRYYPDDHPSRKGCKIVACEADQKFLDELYKYPKDHAFHIRYGGNLYVRGGERIDPDDPEAVRPNRPRLSRQAAKTFIAGSGEDILNEGQRQDDSAAERARKNYEWKNVGCSVLSVHRLYKGIRWDGLRKDSRKIGEQLDRKHYATTTQLCSRTRSSQNQALPCTINFNLWGHDTVGQQVDNLYVQIFERFKARVELLMCVNYTNYQNYNDSNGIVKRIIKFSYQEIYINCYFNYYMYYNFLSKLTVTKCRWSLNPISRMSRMVMCKHRYIILHTNCYFTGYAYYILSAQLTKEKCRRSLNANGGVSRMVMCKHRYTTNEANNRSRRSLNADGNVAKLIMGKQVKSNIIYTGKKKHSANYRYG